MAGFDVVVVGAGGGVVNDPVGAVLGNVGWLELVVGVLNDVLATFPSPHDASVNATRLSPTMACPDRFTESPWPGLTDRPRVISHNDKLNRPRHAHMCRSWAFAPVKHAPGVRGQLQSAVGYEEVPPSPATLPSSRAGLRRRCKKNGPVVSS